MWFGDLKIAANSMYFSFLIESFSQNKVESLRLPLSCDYHLNSVIVPLVQTHLGKYLPKLNSKLSQNNFKDIMVETKQYCTDLKRYICGQLIWLSSFSGKCLIVKRVQLMVSSESIKIYYTIMTDMAIIQHWMMMFVSADIPRLVILF